MAQLEFVTIKKYPENPEVPDHVVVEINEHEMVRWFDHYFAEMSGSLGSFTSWLIRKFKLGNFSHEVFIRTMAGLKEISKARSLR